MKNSRLKHVLYTAGLHLLFMMFSCQKADPQLEPQCYQGTVIGKIRSNGGGLAVSVSSTAFGTHHWRGYTNVVEALNLDNYSSGTKIFFEARAATGQEKTYVITADGDESAKPVIYITQVNTKGCSD